MFFSTDSNYKRLIHSPKWFRIRLLCLQKHPTCERCGRLATEVHHRTPLNTVRDNPAEMERLCFDENNLACLCSECHKLVHIELGKWASQKQNIRNLIDERKNNFEKNWFDK